MKKLIKKISIASASIAVISGGIGAISSVVNTENIQQQIKVDQATSYSFDDNQLTFDRTYSFKFSHQTARLLYLYINEGKTITDRGYLLYMYLIENIGDCSTNFGYNLNDSNDEKSVLSLFQGKNPHTWKNGFNINDFITQLSYGVSSSSLEFLTIYVDYVFLGHNKYAADYPSFK